MIDSVAKAQKPSIPRNVPEVEDLFGTKSRVRISHSTAPITDNKSNISIESPKKLPTVRKPKIAQQKLKSVQPISPKKVGKEQKTQPKPAINQTNPNPVDVAVPVGRKNPDATRKPTSRPDTKFSVNRIQGCPVPQNAR